MQLKAVVKEQNLNIFENPASEINANSVSTKQRMINSIINNSSKSSIGLNIKEKSKSPVKDNVTHVQFDDQSYSNFNGK
jgi:hypothetical protein